MKIYPGPAKIGISGRAANLPSVSASLVEYTTVPGALVASVEAEFDVLTSSTSTVRQDGVLSVSSPIANGPPSLAVVGGSLVDGRVVSDGSLVTYALVTSGGRTQTVRMPSGIGKVTGGSVTKQYSARSSGGFLLRHLIDSVESRIAGRVKADGNLFSSVNHATGAYVRNATGAFGDLDFTGVAVWNSVSNGPWRAGVAITPRHIVCADHYPLSVGATIRFVDSANVTHARTISAVKRHAYSDALMVNGMRLPDLIFYVLSADLPATVKPVKVLPPSFPSRLSYIFEYSWGSSKDFNVFIPSLVLNQDMGASTHYTSQISSLVTNSPNLGVWGPPGSTYEHYGFNAKQPTSGQMAVMSQAVRVGDSGQPAFWVVNGELVLVGLLSGIDGSGGSSGSSLTAFINQNAQSSLQPNGINAQVIPQLDALAGISTGYQVQAVDLSGFPSVS